MRRAQLNLNLVDRTCLGNQEAMDFLGNHWSPYVHAIDDIVDGDREGNEFLLSTFAMAIGVYTHPFFLKHLAELKTLALLVTNSYADSVAWEESSVEWQRDWADHNRHAGMEMVIAVAQICGGYEHARALSQEYRVVCWHEHHAPNGKAI